MRLGMLVSVAMAVFGQLVALGRVGHPIGARLVTHCGWSILIIGCALSVLFSNRRFGRGRRDRSA